MAKQNFRDLDMDTMEQLYYERKERRKKAYDARKHRRNVPQNRMRYVTIGPVNGASTTTLSRKTLASML